MIGKKIYLKRFIIRDMINPIKPIASIPNAEILTIALYSCVDGFLKTCHTLTHFAKKLFIFNIKIREKRDF